VLSAAHAAFEAEVATIDATCQKEKDLEAGANSAKARHQAIGPEAPAMRT
jgi:hypothetical protein